MIIHEIVFDDQIKVYHLILVLKLYQLTFILKP